MVAGALPPRRSRRRFTVFLGFLVWLLLPCYEGFAGDASVFVYHRFGDARYPSTNISLETFEAQLRHLAKERYEVLTLGEVVRRLRAGKDLPDRCAVLTVDDAYASFWVGARPLLRRYGFPATLFVHTAAVGGRDQLTWDQLRTLAEEGVEIGNHTVHHPYLVERRTGETDQAWRARVEEEIVRAQTDLRRELGRAPLLFAYPFGEYSPEIVEIVRQAGFEGAAGQQSGVLSRPDQLYLLPRFPMGGPYATLEGFIQKLQMKHLPMDVLSPGSPLIRPGDRPLLKVRLMSDAVDGQQVRLFVDGRASEGLRADPDQPGVFIAQAESPLSGRRGKYTLTAPGRDGTSWYWFSQLWIVPGRDGG